MPKRKKSRLTQRKGVNIKGASTRQNKNSQNVTSVSTAATIPSTIDTNETAKGKINILQNILLRPANSKATTSTDSGPKLAKGKRRIGYFNMEKIDSNSEDEDIPFQYYSFTQEIVTSIAANKFPLDNLQNMSSEIIDRNLVPKMLAIFPSERDLIEAGSSKIGNELSELQSSHNVLPINIKRKRLSQDSSSSEELAAVKIQTNALIHPEPKHFRMSMDSIDQHTENVRHSPKISPRQPFQYLDAIMEVPIDNMDEIYVHLENDSDISIDDAFNEEFDQLSDGERIDRYREILNRTPENQIHIEINSEDEVQFRLEIQREVERIRRRGNEIASYLMATERILRFGACNLGPFNHVCSFCSALHFSAEKNTRGFFVKCCQQGKVLLQPLRVMPPLLKNLFENKHSQSNHFKQHILQYNYAFQFVSLQATLRDLPTGRAPPVYAIQGKIFHNISDIGINNSRQRYGPIYFLDPDEAINHRQTNNHNVLDIQLLTSIEALLRNVNPYANAYMHLRERYNLELQVIEQLRQDATRQNVEIPPLPMPEVSMELISVRGFERRQYDLPIEPEVAAIYNVQHDAPALPNLRICARHRPHLLRSINHDNELLDPLTFPLLFPAGDNGWHFTLSHNGHHITLCEFYAFRFSFRDAETRLLYGGKLTQQFAVSAYIKIEANNMKYILNNQEKLRAEQYVGLADFLHNRLENFNETNDEAYNLGKMVILPNTYVGSPRYQQQLFQDSMAIVAKFGTPSLFITMTVNPHWPEIYENTPRGTKTADMPTLISRVFNCKAKQYVDDIRSFQIFGKVVSLLNVIEFQKRGLPHMHMLVILKDEDRLRDAIRIDSLISAEIPDKTIEPELYAIVSRNMVHGPCGAYNPNSPCMVNGKCSKGFPKPFCPESNITENGRINYKRRNNGRTITVFIQNRNIMLDNRWIVPYNAYSLLRYNCHINCEVTSSIKSVKYLYKYFFKGADMSLLRLNITNIAEYNEVEQYLNGRYMTAPEALWRINQFPLHFNTHTVYRLCVHLPHRQIVRFQPGFEIEALERNEITQLTGWFILNQNDPNANQYLYTDIPHHYVWKVTNKRWNTRQRGENRIVVRMFNVSLRQQELYYLRLLLLHVRGAQSYEDLRSVSDTIYDTFKEACIERGLLAEDIEWRRALSEAAQRQMPTQLRAMFAYILIFCEVSQPSLLWENYQTSMIEDFVRRNMPQEQAVQSALHHLQSMLITNGTRLSIFGIPEPIEIDNLNEPIDVAHERANGDLMYSNLNPQQSIICDAVFAAIENDSEQNRLFLINAAAGSGKSYLIQTIISKMRGMQLPLIALCPTGIAASLLKGGRTIHSTFKLPFDINETTTCGVTPRSLAGRSIKNTKLIIIDEISMVSHLIFNIVERGLRDICDDNRPFANKVILLAGDFRQTLPVIEKGNRASIVDACVKSSRHFHLFKLYSLENNMRTIEDENFSEWLLNLGNGTLPVFHRTLYGNIIQLPTECNVQHPDQLIDFCFSSVVPKDVLDKAILTTTNDLCHSINTKVLEEKLPGTCRTYFSVDSIDTTENSEAEAANYSVEFLNSLTPSGFPPHQLQLKIDAVIILLRNLNIKKGLCNGTRLIVRVLGNRYIDAEKISPEGCLTGERVFIPRIDLQTNVTTIPFKMKRRQFPVRLGYAMTIHKSQGQTFHKVGIHLPEPVFAHGQLYVAFSRARRLEDIRIFLQNGTMHGQTDENSDSVYTKNIVYKEVL